ncbi:MAG: hypothetical protein JJ866_24540 [Roseibium sp.]|uniref:DUF5983 family protein n=1 Tax=Roseibium sp. TaxID=1936156 RepID=UPI001B189851|nr:hypothetical protein [Roseibium sp.]MBO6895128.1 hypothetical protein [Roseibium sp.]MBO6930840.1 hypothetical protein [Roseibium sp.]
MPVVAMFDTALCHIKMSDYHLLQSMARDVSNGLETPFRVHATEHTIVVHIVWAWPWGTNPDAQQRSWIEERFAEGFSPEFCELVLAAAEHNCWILQLDQDGEVDGGFTVFSDDEPAKTYPLKRLSRLGHEIP